MSQNALVEYEQGLEDLDLMLVRNCLPNPVAQILVGQRLECLETLIGQRWPKLGVRTTLTP